MTGGRWSGPRPRRRVGLDRARRPGSPSGASSSWPRRTELSAALDEAIRGSEGPFVIDLSNVGFLDSSGIACLMRARALLGREIGPRA